MLSMNATAGEIWELLDGRRTVAAIVDALYGRFAAAGVDRATVERDTHEILRDLIARQLVEQIVDNAGG